MQLEYILCAVPLWGTTLQAWIELSTFLWGRKLYCGIAVALMVNSDVEGSEWGVVYY